MLLSAELTQQGFYWYHEWIGGVPALVEVRGGGPPWTVHFCLGHHDERLAGMPGLFQWTVAAYDEAAGAP
ncbi:MAG: hypothetical protein JWP65_1827 [Ramlibacter sp.]|jgi:hypothetical protein|uniref:hypothetical protein n=1 Tax=Ramlibacter sp. TaxID=1917967 RepID=UPI0026034260|nr:hypothetical protein [Ramlibacter sp.]MDB5751406.1 hypothetical protein [Ramlibacter sp.]